MPSKRFHSLNNFDTILKFLAFAFSVFEFFGNISDSFELRKFWTHKTKAIAKDKKVNIAFT